MEPISTAAAAIITGVLTQSAKALVQEAGEAASSAAQALAQAVFDRLRKDPAETKTVERYEREPKRQEASIDAAIDDLMKADAEFATQIKELVARYDRESRAYQSGISVGGNVGGNVVQDNEGVVVNTNMGTINSNTLPDST
jgi:hypothetical protein